VLRLALETDPAWGVWARGHLPEILLDHAHCEKKAAGAAVNLLFRYPEHASLQVPLSELAREELRHFEAVLAELARLDIAFARQRPGPYAGRLHQAARSAEPGRLLDLLLCCAAIEARSCERLTLLSNELDDGPLRTLYRGLLAAEARHHALYVELATELYDEREVRERLEHVMAREADAIGAAPAGLARLHSGPLAGS
jgi:tRNA-(ms[2]io[6]A)-hydroxylase